jgi:hypothetical protein
MGLLAFCPERGPRAHARKTAQVRVPAEERDPCKVPRLAQLAWDFGGGIALFIPIANLAMKV